MNTRISVCPGYLNSLPAMRIALFSVMLLPLGLYAQSAKKKNPTSKVYFSDVSGEAQIDTGESVQDLAKRSVYNAEGTTIETKTAEREEDKNKIFSTMVYSNGTGAYFDHDTRVEVKRFVQEPFTPNRGDMEVEPSISQTQAFVSRGAVGLCTSKSVAGSSMVYNTPHGAVNIRGRKIVIEAMESLTKISMLEGDSTVMGGVADLGGHTLHAGEQAIIRPGVNGGPASVEVGRIPSNELGNLDDKVAMACMAKKTVYFEVKEQIVGSAGAESAETAAGADNPSTNPSDAPVTAFDGEVSKGNSSTTSNIVREIVVVDAVPVVLPPTPVSPATLVSRQAGTGG